MDKLSLTQYGLCWNAWCGAPLFQELAKRPGDLCCFDCSPFEKLWTDSASGYQAFDMGNDSVMLLDAFGDVFAYLSQSEADALTCCLKSGGRLV